MYVKCEKNISREFWRKIISEIWAKNMVVKNQCIVNSYNFVHPMCFCSVTSKSLMIVEPFPHETICICIVFFFSEV